MAETLIPLEEREEERRPSRVEPPRRSGGWVGKLALVLAVVALAVACLALYRTLPPGEDDPQEPGERAESPTISYRDRELPVLEGVAVNSYVSDGFSVNDRGWLTYEQDGKQAAIGIDVSAYQGEIDWQAVASSGVEFAMIRVGYRGYSQGGLQLDERFQENMDGALAAGLDVGVYFFSQATSVLEAEEEADFVLSAIRGYTQGQGQMLPTAVSQVVESAGKLVVGLGLTWYLLTVRGVSPEIGAAGAMAGVTVGSLLALLVLALRWLPSCMGSDAPPSRREVLGQLLKIGVPITLGAGGMSFITLLDQSVAMDALQSRLGLGLEEANRQYGEYAFALTLFSLPPSFLYPISVSLVPAISGALGQGDRRTARRHTRTALRMALLLALPSGIGLSVLAGPVLRLLYPAQVQTAAAAAHHLRVLGLAAVCVCLMVVSGGILQAWGHEHIPVVTLLTGGAVKIAVSYQLVSDPAWGIRGAAVGTLLCYALIAGMNLLAVGRTTGIVFRWGVPLRTLVAVGAMAVTASGFYRMLVHRASLPLAVLGAVAAAAAVYGGLVLLLGAVRREELCAVFAAKKRRKPSGFF